MGKQSFLRPQWEQHVHSALDFEVANRAHLRTVDRCCTGTYIYFHAAREGRWAWIYVPCCVAWRNGCATAQYEVLQSSDGRLIFEATLPPRSLTSLNISPSEELVYMLHLY